MTLSFIVFGIAQPQGSAKAFIPKGWTRAVITSDNPKNKDWRQTVAVAAMVAITASPFEYLNAGPVALALRFYLPRPKSKARREVPHTVRPDADKLLRSVSDALTGIIWKDDAQVTEVALAKQYAEPGGLPRVEISVRAASGGE